MNNSDLEIKKIRSELGLSQDELAGKIGVTIRTIQNWEAGKVIPKSKHELLRSLLVVNTTVEVEKELIITNNVSDKRIPLVNQSAIAGFGNSNFSISEQDVKEYYVIPKFKYCKIDFMIEVSGSSMYPKYNSGDVIACTIIRDSNFIQWNKCHVIATREQGILVKRLKKSVDSNHLIAISDNKDYDPFQIPVKEITGIALVVGVIRIE